MAYSQPDPQDIQKPINLFVAWPYPALDPKIRTILKALQKNKRVTDKLSLVATALSSHLKVMSYQYFKGFQNHLEPCNSLVLINNLSYIDFSDTCLTYSSHRVYIMLHYILWIKEALIYFQAFCRTSKITASVSAKEIEWYGSPVGDILLPQELTQNTNGREQCPHNVFIIRTPACFIRSLTFVHCEVALGN